MQESWIVVGLGNPGEKYAHTRHNIGRTVVEQLAPLVGVTRVIPDTYMNLSGGPVAKATREHPEAKLVIVHDDIDLPYGEVKVSVGKGSGGQKGVEDIIQALGTKDFIRVRIGIVPVHFGTPRKPKGSEAVSRFVLKPFGILERGKLPEVLRRASAAIEEIVTNGPTIAMNKFN